ncbi:hypothetical protein HLY00_2723 [Mycolicibacterium hippocampi]|uniref:Uncharacterized protein n=1 Tax=Mycolicibacterium hippocampi TaxID=659824 RepID=A0A850PDW7_9MYCO|nr:hypothetical protein [Mycolicibacterium hippocampi]
MTTQSTVVSTGHGDSIASTGAKKKPAPMYHDEPARSQISTKRNHRGMFGSDSMGDVMALPLLCLPFTVPAGGRRHNYLGGSGQTRIRRPHSSS